MRSGSLRRVLLVGAASASLLPGCDAGPDPALQRVVEPKPPRFVLLYATCSLNRAFLAPYSEDPGDDGSATARAPTPALAAFARRARVFMRHQTESGQSGTAFASIFSGRQAPHHGVYAHPSRLDDRLELITEHFAAGGYETHSWLDQLMAGAGLGYAQGVPEARQHPDKLTARDSAFVALLDSLADDPARRAFVVTNFTLTHGPYHGRELDEFCVRYPGGCAARQLADFDELRHLYRKNHIAFAWDFERTAARLGLDASERARLAEITDLLYRADVWLVDYVFGEIVDALRERGLFDEAVIAFTSDHGEIQVREGFDFRWTHGMQLAPSVLNVPLLISGPHSGVVSGRWQNVTRSIDVYPTLAGLAGLPPIEADGIGVDLSAAVRGRAPEPQLIALSHTALLPSRFRAGIAEYPALRARFPRPNALLMWVSARRGDEVFELRRPEGSMRFETYLHRLDRDPDKTRNLFDPTSPDHLEMRGRLLRYKRELTAHQPRRASPTRAESDDAERRLQALGYIE